MKNISAKKWILSFVSVVLAMCVLFAGLTFAVDPFFQFRARDNTYLLNGRYVSAGLIKNYDYDTLILGSSMVQNFDMQQFRDEIGGKPLHIGVNGMSAKERDKVLKLAYKTGKAKNYYICAELYQFAGIGDDHLPDYFMKDDVLSTLKYCVSFESWFRYLPVDTALLLAKKAGVTLPDGFSKNMSIDMLDNWSGDFKFGRDVVLRGFETGEAKVSKVNTKGLEKRMLKGIDEFFNSLDANAEYTFFFPPYSSLYWAITEKEGYFDEYMSAKKYFVQKAEEKGISVYDFQDEPFTIDLDNYKDTTHYKQEINSYMLTKMANGENKINQENLDGRISRLKENTDTFLRNTEITFD